MSADLLAEFDSFYQAPEKRESTSNPASNDLSFLEDTQHKPQHGNQESPSQWQHPSVKPDDDIWGDMNSFQPHHIAPQNSAPLDDVWGSFESVVQKPRPALETHNEYVPDYGGSMLDFQETPGPQKQSTFEIFSNTNDFEQFKFSKNGIMHNQNTSFQPKAARRTSTGGEILFDADEMEDEDEDEFGDFESGAVPQPLIHEPTASRPLEGLFGATSMKDTRRPKQLLPTEPGLGSSGLPYPQAPKSPSFQDRNPFSHLGLSTSQASAVKNGKGAASASPVTAWPAFEPSNPKPDSYRDSPAARSGLDDDWGDFVNLSTDSKEKSISSPIPSGESDTWAWDVADGVSEAASRPEEVPPPTNLPPPSVILPLFLPLFELSGSSLFKPVAGQTISLKNRILSQPATIEFLRAYLLIATVAARVIAGRKQRWKRDALLSQAMKIGPAVAGGKSGMKLAGVDKAETTREDREAADVVRAWKDQLGRLKSAIAVANSSMQNSTDHLIIPEISETMLVKVQDGASRAPKQCLICGLKREERVKKVDVQVEDSFGEWWTEHWGHRACKNFWLEHESKLKQR